MADVDRSTGGKAIIGSARDPVDVGDHFYVCPACGQIVDMRDLGAVLHHEDDGHQPLPPATARRVLDAIAMLYGALGARE